MAQVKLAANINPGSRDSTPSNFIVFNDRLFFSAFTAATGMELWVSDGTAAGTKLVKDISPGASSSDPRNFTVFNNRLFFTATDAVNGTELWESDGTSEGTRLVKDIFPGADSSFAADFIVFNNKLYFQATTAAHGRELWESDGTSEGTKLAVDIFPGSGGSTPAGFVVFNNKLYFRAEDTTHAAELWESDGTPEGTRLVKDIFPGINSSFPLFLTVFNNKLYFSASDAANGKELWESDGTAAGTKLVKDINPGASDFFPLRFTLFNNKLYFTAGDGGINDGELWESDGTPEGTKLALELPLDSYFTNFAVFNNRLYFSGEDATNGRELWESDGTPAGTKITVDINPGSRSSNPGDFVVFNNKLYFRAFTSPTGSELFVLEVNRPPSAANQTVSVQEDTTYTFSSADFLFTDTDSGDSLVTIKVTALPVRGSLSLEEAAVTLNQEIAAADIEKLSFTPAPGESGTAYASFGFQVSDGKDYSIIHTLTIDVAAINDAPIIIQGDAPLTVSLSEDNSPDAFELSLTGTDAENDSLFWSIDSNAQPSHGRASVDPTGQVSYQPNPNYSGSDSFVVRLSDGNGGIDSITLNLTVTPVNDAPTVNRPIDRLTVQAGTAFSLSLIRGFSDVDADDSLSFTASLSGGAPLPSWLSFDAATGQFSGTPSATNVGQLNLKVTATDAASASVSDEFVLIVSAPPVGPNLPGNSNPLIDPPGNFNSPPNPTSPLPSVSPPAQTQSVPSPGSTAQFIPQLFESGKPGQLFKGDAASDKIRGTANNDRIRTGGGNDTIWAGQGNDILNCGNGSDRANGGAGNDILIGGAGRDQLTGGTGQDLFAYHTPALGIDRIRDFNVGQDWIDLSRLLAQPIYDASSPLEKFQRYVQLEQTSGGTLVKVDSDGGAGTKMISLALLQGVEASNLTSSSFVV